MMNYLRLQVIAIQQAIRYLRQQLLANIMTIAVLAITLALPIGMWQLSNQIEHLASQWQGKPQATIYLNKTVTSDQINQFEERLSQLKSLSSYEFKSADDALAEFETDSGLDDIASALDTNPLPDVFILNLDESIDGEEIEAELKPLSRLKIGEQTVVEDIRFDLLWVKRLQAVFNLAKKFSLLIGSLIAIAAMLIISNTIRLSISSRKAEIDVINRIGGTAGFIRRPFTYTGAIQGFISALLALLIITLASAWISPAVRNLFQLYSGEFSGSAIDIKTWLMIIAASTFIAAMTAYFTVTRFLFQYRPGK